MALTNSGIFNWKKSLMEEQNLWILNQGILKGGSITVPLTSCLTGLDQPVLQIKTKIVNNQTADFKLVKQEVNSTVILPPLVFPDKSINLWLEWEVKLSSGTYDCFLTFKSDLSSTTKRDQNHFSHIRKRGHTLRWRWARAFVQQTGLSYFWGWGQFVEQKQAEASLLNKSSCIAPTLGVT